MILSEILKESWGKINYATFFRTNELFDTVEFEDETDGTRIYEAFILFFFFGIFHLKCFLET